MTPADLEKIILTEQCDRLLQYRLYESSLPQYLVKVASLYWLCLTNRQITSIPDNIGGFTYFTKIHLSYNRLTSLPGSFGKLANLIELNLDNNQFTKVPDSIVHLTNLTTLDLSCNQLTYLPANLHNLVNLRSLSLSHNNDLSIYRAHSYPESTARDGECGSGDYLGKSWHSSRQICHSNLRKISCYSSSCRETKACASFCLH
jgi:Leucine-rich repeat (LRR) protein